MKEVNCYSHNEKPLNSPLISQKTGISSPEIRPHLDNDNGHPRTSSIVSKSHGWDNNNCDYNAFGFGFGLLLPKSERLLELFLNRVAISGNVVNN